MIDIKPFKGTKPYNEDAKNLIAPSTDHLSEDSILDIFEKNYWNYLKVLNPVGQTREKDALIAAKKHFSEMKENHIIKQDNKACFYVYRIKTSNHAQVGFLAVANINMFITNIIKGHEKTYQTRTDERAEQMMNLNSQIGPIYVTYKDYDKLDDLLFQFTLNTPQYDFISFDNSQHTLWNVEDEDDVNNMSIYINNITKYYIADGHHRISAMKKIFDQKSSLNINHSGQEGYNYFMISAFPSSKSKIFDYNRVIKNLNGLSVQEFISKIKLDFDCEKSATPVLPNKPKEFGMYHDNQWYFLKFKKQKNLSEDILSNLDINILNEYCLTKTLGIKDINKDERIRFIAGCHGLESLEKKVNENQDSVAFSVFPTQISQVIEVANNNLTMPPKTTWFDPKPLDGLVVYEFEQL